MPVSIVSSTTAIVLAATAGSAVSGAGGCLGLSGDARAECAETKLAAFETDPGIRSLAWRSPDGSLLWSAPLDIVGPTHLEAARALVASDRVDEAADMLGQALSLGAAGESIVLWAEIGRDEPPPGLDASPTPLHARPWYPRLPRVKVPIVNGAPFQFAEARGDVLILDFWASWCEPCLRELPAIGRLFESEKENGLRVIAVNSGESPVHAERFARNLGLEIPIGLYDEALETAFDVGSLPTVIVADRDGRVRARWDGYREGLETEIATLARSLLDPGDEDPGEKIGEIVRGGGEIEIEWVRNISGDVDGLAVVKLDEPGPDPGLVAIAGRHTLVYDDRGVVADFADRPPGVGALRVGDLDGDGRDELFSFRVGGTIVTKLDVEGGAQDSWSSPGPLRDLVLLPANPSGNGVAVVATMSGLYRLGEDFHAEAIPGFTAAKSLIPAPGAEGPRLGVLDGERGLCWLNPTAPEGAECSPIENAARLVPGIAGAGFGVAPRGVAAVPGRFFRPGEGCVASLTSTGQLVILDAATGAERVRARLDGPRALAAGDLDGDGLDELALALGRRIVVLKKPGFDASHGPLDLGKRADSHHEPVNHDD